MCKDHRRTSMTTSARVATSIVLLTAMTPMAGADAAAPAQAGVVTVSGSLSDQLGGLLPGVIVTLSNLDTRGSRTTNSDRGGYFIFNEVTPGEYELEAQLPGFQTHRQKILLRAGQSLQRDVALSIGAISETVSIRGSRSPDAAALAPQPEQAQPGPRRPSDRRTLSACTGAIGGCIDTPRRLNSVNPVYPAGLQASGIAGGVELTGRIGVDGLVTGLEVVEAAHPGLADAALAAVGQWEFDPTLLNGVPVETQIMVTLRFDLEP